MVFVFPEAEQMGTHDNGIVSRWYKCIPRGLFKELFVATGMLVNILQRERKKDKRVRNFEMNEN